MQFTLTHNNSLQTKIYFLMFYHKILSCGGDTVQIQTINFKLVMDFCLHVELCFNVYMLSS